MEALADLRKEVVTERTEEGLDLWRAEIRDGYGNIRDCSRFSTNPVVAHRLGDELLAQVRSDVAYSQARSEAHRLFTPAA